MSKNSLSSKLTESFIQSPLTPLILVTIIFLGALALVSLPREEEPQISVPMVDILVNADGLSAKDAVELVTKPLETIIQGIDGVEHIYSQTQDHQVVVTARFKVGFNADTAIVRVNERINAHLNEIPYGIKMPLISAKSIDDVAIMVLNLYPKKDIAERYDDVRLYEIAQRLQQDLVKIPDIGTSYIVGGRVKQVRIEPNPDKMLLYQITLDGLITKIKNANYTGNLDKIYVDQQTLKIAYGKTFKTVHELENLTLTTSSGKTVYLKDLADIKFEGQNVMSRAWFYDPKHHSFLPTVAIAIAKKPGTNAVTISKEVEERLENLKGTLIPDNLEVKITRDYGKTASEKSNRLLEDLLGATLSVVLLIGFLIGWREALVVLFVIPATILGTMFIAWILGYTINRVSLFALIFSIGILVDDAIVFIENIVRHWREKPKSNRITTAIEAVVEVGNPTIMATLTIIVALLPMLFVSGLMGPYMSPIPINASVAMFLSLLIAFIIVPWLLLKIQGDKPASEHPHGESLLSRKYRDIAHLLVYNRKLCFKFMVIVVTITFALCGLFITKNVTVKMLPFDNKSELVIQLDLPKDATLEDTDKYMKMVNHSIKNVPELLDTQLYVGTAAPFNFNGLVKHSYVRNSPYFGEIQVNLVPKGQRSRSSHDIAIDIRTRINALTYPDRTVVKVLEVPPGPPVLSTLLAEIYGPTAEMRRDLARAIKEIYQKIPFLKDIDDSFGYQTEQVRLSILHDRLDHYKADEEAVYRTLGAILGKNLVGYIHHANGRYPTEIGVEMAKSTKILNDRLLSVLVPTKSGTTALSNLIYIEKAKTSYPIFRHNGYDTEMVMAELSGSFEAPIYGMLAVNDAINKKEWEKSLKPKILYHGQPSSEQTMSVLWDGEWEITYVTFRDMGASFIVALLGIYALLVAQFKRFTTPVVILVPIPLVLIGIIMGHFIFQAPFTATSMIGLIALAGIVVRNSLLLVEFIRFRLSAGDPLPEALIEAGAKRITPIMMTAVAAMIGAVFMFFDPIFQGLALSLFFGLLSSTILTLFAIPALYILAKTK